MKLLLFIINLLCLSFCVSNTINQETIVRINIILVTMFEIKKSVSKPQP